MYLDHREGFEMDAGAALLQPAHHFQIVIEGQIGMQTADDVKFGRAFAHALFRALINFFERIHVRAGSIRIAPKRAQPAMRQANIRRIDMPIDVEIGDVAVPLLANVVREPADSQQDRASDRARMPSSIDSRSPAKTLSAIGFKRLSVMVSSAMFRSKHLKHSNAPKGRCSAPEH